MCADTEVIQNVSVHTQGTGNRYQVEWYFSDLEGNKVAPSRYRLTYWTDGILALDFYGDHGRKLFYYKWKVRATDVGYAIAAHIRNITPMEEDGRNINWLISLWNLLTTNKLPFARSNSIKITRAGNNPAVVRRFFLGEYRSMLPIRSCCRLSDHLH